ncbi:immunoglobulin superfamily member 11 isoform X1 [Plectropomus leopardus]|uniref:immunoglobulin superfamily member 11 isoform X1 n=1 Tax=Plectropomus leopardus TaxID=160734 RepID=UPI001C4CD69F|nr:immunoglobulin superfamily member 11 isoform X1 [Plectropomus leopardus]
MTCVCWSHICLFNRHSCTQGNHEGIQSRGGSRGCCCHALLLLHLQSPLQTQHYLDSGSLFESRNPNTETADPGIGELELSVLAPPSLPVCQWDGDIDMGGSVTLSCSVAEGVPTPEIHWDKLNPEEIALPINMEGDLSGSVQIVNVSSQTSGLYRCSATNLLGTENCYVNLSIYTTPDTSSGILQGVLLTLSMSLVLLALLVLVLWLHRTGQDGRWREGKEEDEEECYNEIRYTPSLMKRSFV